MFAVLQADNVFIILMQCLKDHCENMAWTPCVMVILLLGTLQAVSAGNINTDQCPALGGGCVQCISSATPEVERCIQLRFLITLTVSSY